MPGQEPAGAGHVPHGTVFATKTQLGTAMVTGAIGAGVPFGWAAGYEVCGRSSRLRAACEKDGKGYVFAVPVNFQVTLPSGRKAAVGGLARLVPRRCWETRSCGPGCKGHRDYDWACGGLLAAALPADPPQPLRSV